MITHRHAFIWCMALGLLSGSHTFADLTPPLGTVDPRVRVVAYDPDQVVQVKGYVGYQIHLEFEPGEHFVNMAAGDNKALDVGSEGNHLMIKPLAPKVSTNITIITTRHVYHLDYSASSQHPNMAKGTVIYSLRFIYPHEEAKRAAAQLDQLRTAERLRTAEKESDQQQKNMNYWACGDESLRPVAAWDDGVQTYLRFGARSEFPAMYVQHDDESEGVVNFTVLPEERDVVVVHRVARRFILRRGQLISCVENRSFDGGGTSVPTKTLLPGFERRTQGVETP